MTRTVRIGGLRRMLIAGALSAASLAGAPALADTLGYYYDGSTTVVQEREPTTTTTTTTYTETAPAPTHVYTYEHERERDRDRDHGAGIHLNTPIFNFGVGIH